MPGSTSHPATTTAGSLGRSQFVQITRQHGVLTVQPVGPTVAEREAGIIDTEVSAVMADTGSGLKAVVLDMTRVTFMSSMGLSMCINTGNRAKAVKARTIVFGLNDELLGLFKMVKLDKFFTLARSAEELAKAVGQ